MTRKTKRTAGQRRYLQLKRKTNDAISKLGAVQSIILVKYNESKTTSPLWLMKEITETIERLRHEH